MQDHCGDNSVSVLLLTMERLTMRMMMMVLTIPVIGVSNGMAGGVDLILIKACPQSAASCLYITLDI